jgi:translation elongation factor EF-1beta
MTKATKPAGDVFIEQLEKAISKILTNPKTTAKDRNQAIANGIKLAHIKHRISPDDDGSFFGGET